ncbi:MAG: LysR substrate-binding domain-containing protein [Comamonas sp.]|uniref:LysR substrate-binding domain-containing protein n=1 Tax=Comamonas sp. TaxID=34028 RepID=UPI002FC7BDF4
MSTARYRAFVAVAHHGSLSAAARALQLSQPTISAQISALEQHSPVELFHRRGYRMSLSSAGAQLLPIAQKILALEAEADFFLRDSGQLNQGQLHLGAVGPFHVIEMVAAHRLRRPGIEVSIRMGNSRQVLADLEQYTTDIGVLAGSHDNPALESLLYARHPIILFAHREHPLARHASVPLERLEGMELLRREAGSTTQATMDAALRDAGVRTRCALEVGSREALREAVARGLGVGAVSEAEFIADPRFVPVRIDGDPATTSTYLYYARERRRSLLIQSFLQAQRIAPPSEPPA